MSVKFFDLLKAFDTVCHKTLLFKFKKVWFSYSWSYVISYSIFVMGLYYSLRNYAVMKINRLVAVKRLQVLFPVSKVQEDIQRSGGWKKKTIIWMRSWWKRTRVRLLGTWSVKPTKGNKPWNVVPALTTSTRISWVKLKKSSTLLL